MDPVTLFHSDWFLPRSNLVVLRLDCTLLHDVLNRLTRFDAVRSAQIPQPRTFHFSPYPTPRSFLLALCHLLICPSPSSMTDYGLPEERTRRDNGRANGVGDVVVKTEGKRLRFHPTVEHAPAFAPEDFGHPHPRSHQPAIPPPEFSRPVNASRDIPRQGSNFPLTTDQTPPPRRPRRSCSHSRTHYKPAVSSVDLNLAEAPFIPPQPKRWYKTVPVPSVVPPGYPEGTSWILDPDGKPRLEVSSFFSSVIPHCGLS